MIEERGFDFINKPPPLGHPDHHFIKYPGHPWIKNKDDVIGWVKEHFVNGSNAPLEDVVVNDDMTVEINDSTGKLKMFKKSLYLKVKINWNRMLDCNAMSLVSLVGVSEGVSDLFVMDNFITGFEGVENINKNAVIFLNNNYISDFMNIPKGLSSIQMQNNPIKSWNGWDENVKIKELGWSQKEWCDKISFSLLLNAPKSIECIMIEESFESPKIKKFNMNFIDMIWLREVQKNNEILNEVNIALGDNDKVNKKRKL